MTEHLDRVGYADVTEPVPDLSTWQVNAAGQVWGDCPRCKGQAAGPSDVAIPDVLGVPAGEDATAKAEVAPAGPTGSAQVPVACCCGYAHGTHNGSCGWRATVQYDGAVLSVIPLSPADDDAVRIVQRHRVNRLAETQKRGQNWLAGNAAILALLGSAVIFQAPDDIRKLRTGASVLVLVLAIAGLAALAVSIYFAYAAAYGSVNGTRVDQLIDADRSDYRGLSTALEQAVHADVASSRRNLVCAVWLAIAGVVVVALAAALAGVLPQEKSDSSSGGGMCLKAGTAILNVGTAPDVVSAGTVTYAECPKK